MTQKQKFVEAKKYFIEALDVLDSSCITNDNTHLKAVINQNLGAVLNFTKDFYKAIQRHTKAKNCYGKHLKHKANSWGNAWYIVYWVFNGPCYLLFNQRSLQCRFVLVLLKVCYLTVIRSCIKLVNIGLKDAFQIFNINHWNDVQCYTLKWADVYALIIPTLYTCYSCLDQSSQHNCCFFCLKYKIQ